MAEKLRKPAMQKTESTVMREIDADDDHAATKKGKFDFPHSLAEFGLRFNEEGQLRNMETGEAFVFKIKEDQQYNQKRYEAIGQIITDYVYELLETEANLKKIILPVDSKRDEPTSFFFMSDNAMKNPDKLLLLIHGSGVVRAGQWARRLIINDCLDSGTQLPFIKKAVEEGYGVMVFNTNLNKVEENGEVKPIRGSESPEQHGSYVWDHFVTKAAAKHIAIIAHSYGGIVTTDLAIEKEDEFRKRVFAIAFTDSVHSLFHQEAPKSTFDYYEQVAQNWISSEEPLDSPIPNLVPDCPKVSAGHPKHEHTSWSSFESIFKYLSNKYAAIQTGDKEEL